MSTNIVDTITINPDAFNHCDVTKAMMLARSLKKDAKLVLDDETYVNVVEPGFKIISDELKVYKTYFNNVENQAHSRLVLLKKCQIFIAEVSVLVDDLVYVGDNTLAYILEGETEEDRAEQLINLLNGSENLIDILKLVGKPTEHSSEDDVEDYYNCVIELHTNVHTVRVNKGKFSNFGRFTLDMIAIMENTSDDYINDLLVNVNVPESNLSVALSAFSTIVDYTSATANGAYAVATSETTAAVVGAVANGTVAIASGAYTVATSETTAAIVGAVANGTVAAVKTTSNLVCSIGSYFYNYTTSSSDEVTSTNNTIVNNYHYHYNGNPPSNDQTRC